MHLSRFFSQLSRDTSFCSTWKQNKKKVIINKSLLGISVCIGKNHCINVLLLLFSRPVMSDSLWPHGLQHTRLLCPPLSPTVCPNSCPLSQWCHPTISSSVAPFSSCPQSFPASGSLLISQLFTSDDQNTGASALFLPTSIQGWFPLKWTGLITLLSKGLSRVFSSTTVWKHRFFGTLSLNYHLLPMR